MCQNAQYALGKNYDIVMMEHSDVGNRVGSGECSGEGSGESSGEGSGEGSVEGSGQGSGEGSVEGSGQGSGQCSGEGSGEIGDLFQQFVESLRVWLQTDTDSTGIINRFAMRFERTENKRV